MNKITSEILITKCNEIQLYLEMTKKLSERLEKLILEKDANTLSNTTLLSEIREKNLVINFNIKDIEFHLKECL